MLAGRPNPNDTPKRNDIIKTSKVLVTLTNTRTKEEIIPINIQYVRKVVLLQVSSITVAPTIAEKMAAPKWVIHITVDASCMMLVRMLKAKEYHIRALDISTTLANAALEITLPSFQCI